MFEAQVSTLSSKSTSANQATQEEGYSTAKCNVFTTTSSCRYTCYLAVSVAVKYNLLIGLIPKNGDPGHGFFIGESTQCGAACPKAQLGLGGSSLHLVSQQEMERMNCLDCSSFYQEEHLLILIAIGAHECINSETVFGVQCV